MDLCAVCACVGMHVCGGCGVSSVVCGMCGRNRCACVYVSCPGV